jgi:hypothetical protein
MGQQLQSWRSGNGERAWLSSLVATMERVARPEIRALYCDSQMRAAVTAQLARPASPYAYAASEFRLRN